MVLFIGSKRFSLRNKIPSILTIIVCPAMYFRNFARPVAVTRPDGRGPFQGIRSPGIQRRYPSPFKNGIEEVEYKHELNGKYHHGHIGDELVQTRKHIEGTPSAVVHITAGHTRKSFVMHRPENEISTHQRYPEMDIRHRIVQISTEHFRKPVINTAEHAEEGRHTHYQVKVRDHEIRIMQMNVECRVPDKYPGKSPGNKNAHKSDREQHPRCEPEIPPPEGREPVKHFNCRRHRN